jgi:dCMP deaminase
MNRYEYYMELAKLTAKRSTCLSRQVGAVIIGNNRVISLGYNGPPSGYPHCETCLRKLSSIGKNLDNCPALHAESNAILEAVKSTRHGDTLFVTTEPCFECSKIIVQYGIKSVIYLEGYNASDLCNEFLIKNGVVKEKYEPNKY